MKTTHRIFLAPIIVALLLIVAPAGASAGATSCIARACNNQSLKLILKTMQLSFNLYNDLYISNGNPMNDSITVQTGSTYRIQATFMDDAVGFHINGSSQLSVPDDNYVLWKQHNAYYNAGWSTSPQNISSITYVETQINNIRFNIDNQIYSTQEQYARENLVYQSLNRQLLSLIGNPMPVSLGGIETPGNNQTSIFSTNTLVAPSQPTTLTYYILGTEYQNFSCSGSSRCFRGSSNGIDIAGFNNFVVSHPGFDTTPGKFVVNVVSSACTSNCGGVTKIVSPACTSNCGTSGSSNITILPPYPSTASENAYNEAQLQFSLLPTTNSATTSKSPRGQIVVVKSDTIWVSSVKVAWQYTPASDLTPQSQSSGVHYWNFGGPLSNPQMSITVPPGGVGVQWIAPTVATVTFTVTQTQSDNWIRDPGNWVTQYKYGCSLSPLPPSDNGVCPSADVTKTITGYTWSGTATSGTKPYNTTTTTYSKSYRVSSLGSVLNSGY